jgi:hypothetical protein
MSYQYVTCPKCGKEDVPMPNVWGGLYPPKVEDTCGCNQEVNTSRVSEMIKLLMEKYE